MEMHYPSGFPMLLCTCIYLRVDFTQTMQPNPLIFFGHSVHLLAVWVNEVFSEEWEKEAESTLCVCVYVYGLIVVISRNSIFFYSGKNLMSMDIEHTHTRTHTHWHTSVPIYWPTHKWTIWFDYSFVDCCYHHSCCHCRHCLISRNWLHLKFNVTVTDNDPLPSIHHIQSHHFRLIVPSLMCHSVLPSLSSSN